MFLHIFISFENFCTNCVTCDLLHPVEPGVALVLVLVHTSYSLNFRHNENSIDDESKYVVNDVKAPEM